MLELKKILNGKTNFADLASETAKAAAATVMPPLAPITNKLIDNIGSNFYEKNKEVEPVPPTKVEEEKEISALEEFKRWKKQPFYALAKTKGEAEPVSQNDKKDMIDDYYSQFSTLGTIILKEYRLQLVKLKKQLKKVDPQSFLEGDIQSEIDEVNIEINFWESDLNKDYMADKSAQFSEIYLKLDKGFDKGKSDYTNWQVLKAKK